MAYEDYVFDTVKFEKKKAMTRYNRFKTIKNLVVVFEVLVALTLISWSSTFLPQAFKVSGDYFIQIADYVFKPHVIFLIGNFIIVVLVFLCRETDAGSNYDSSSGDFYDDYVHYSQRKVVLLPEANKSLPTSPVIKKKITDGRGTDAEYKPIVFVEPVEEKVIQINEEHIKVEEEEILEEQSSVVATVIEDATKETPKLFQRTQSARLKRDSAMIPRLELRRSETSRRSDSPSLGAVDNLSNEEFNLTVAAFIKRHQEFLLHQKLGEKEEL